MNLLALASIGVIGLFASLQPAAEGLKAPERLRCEWLENPTCIDTVQPRFSWEVRDPRRAAVQSAYELHVGTTPANAASAQPDVWSSGKVASAETMNVSYGGPPLRSGATYFWTVRTWDGADAAWAAPASFGMGLAKEDWKAKWIGDQAAPPPAREHATASTPSSPTRRRRPSG